MAQEHPAQFVATRFKLLPKEVTAEVQKTHDFGTLSETMALVERINKAYTREEQKRRAALNKPLPLVKSG
jgi:hypothetical protein